MANVSSLSVGERPLVGADTQLAAVPAGSQSIWAWESLESSWRMTEGKEGAASCFGLVTKRIRQIFRHFPQGKPCSAGLHLPRRPSREVLLLPGRCCWALGLWAGFAAAFWGVGFALVLLSHRDPAWVGTGLAAHLWHQVASPSSLAPLQAWQEHRAWLLCQLPAQRLNHGSRAPASSGVTALSLPEAAVTQGPLTGVALSALDRQKQPLGLTRVCQQMNPNLLV